MVGEDTTKEPEPHHIEKESKKVVENLRERPE